MISSPSGRERIFLPLLAVAFTAVVYLTPPLTLFETWDQRVLHLINRHYATERILSGHLPLWNPYVGLGRPFLADIETAVFYPPNLLYLVLDPTSGLFVLTALHCALALIGMVKLGRHLGLDEAVSAMAAFCFVACAPLVGRLLAGQGPYTHASCYLPLLFFFAARLQDAPSRPRLAALAAGLGLQVLCGHPQICWITWVGLGGFLLGRSSPPSGAGPHSGAGLRFGPGRVARDLGGLGLALALGLGLAAVQLLPFFELVGQGNRADPSLAFAAGGTMAWRDWASLVLPTDLHDYFYWEFNLYAGIVCLIAGVCGLARLQDRNARGFLLAALLGGLISAGTRTPVFRLLYSVIPGLPAFHIHSRAGVLVTFALIMGAALFLSTPARSRLSAFLLPASGLAAIAVVLLGSDPAPTGRRLVRVLVVLLAATLLAWLRLRASTGSPREAAVARALVLALAMGEVAGSLIGLKLAYGQPPLVYQERVVVEALARNRLYAPSGVPPRIAVPPWLVRDNSGLLYKYSSFSGYVSLSLDRVWTYIHLTRDLSPSLDMNTFPRPEIYLAGPFPYSSMNIVLGEDLRTSTLVVNPDPDPRAYVANEVKDVSSWREAIRAMKDGHDFHRVALVEEALAWKSDASSPPATTTIVAFEPERVVVETDAAGPGLLVLAESWYPGWKARVDGREAPCLPANAWMRAVPVPAGRHQVVLRFESTYLALGALVSALSAGLLLASSRSSARRASS